MHTASPPHDSLLNLVIQVECDFSQAETLRQSANHTLDILVRSAEVLKEQVGSAYWLKSDSEHAQFIRAVSAPNANRVTSETITVSQLAKQLGRSRGTTDRLPC